MTNMSTNEYWRRGTVIKLLAVSGIAIACMAPCWQEAGTSQCVGHEIADCNTNNCVNFYSTVTKYCDWRDDPPTGFQSCTESSTPCIKTWQQQTCYPAGSGPYPTHTTPYCANPGPQNHVTSGTTTKATGSGDCPSY